MRAILSVGILAVLITGNHGQVQKAKPDNVQKTSESTPPKTIAPIADLAPTQNTESRYQKTKDYLKKAFGPESLASWILVIAAGFGLGATFRTLGILREQTRATENAANAALLNAQAVLNAERPWLVPSPERHEYVFTVGICNKGRTPALIISGTFDRTEITKPDLLPLTPKYSSPFMVPDLDFIATGDSFPILPRVNPESLIASSPDQALFEQARKFLIFYGHIIYRDVLTKEAHETRWCFAYSPHEKSFIRTGPEEYNRYT